MQLTKAFATPAVAIGFGMFLIGVETIRHFEGATSSARGPSLSACWCQPSLATSKTGFQALRLIRSRKCAS